MCIVLKVYNCTLLSQHVCIPRQDVIESGKKMCVCVWGGGGRSFKLSIIMHFLSGRSRTRLKNASEIWTLDLDLNLDLELDLDLAEIWISIASNKM